MKWQLVIHAIRAIRIMICGCFLILMLWDWFILHQDRGYYFLIFAFAQALYLVEDTIRYRNNIPFKDGSVLTEDAYHGRVWRHFRRLASWGIAAAFHLYYLRTHSALPFV